VASQPTVFLVDDDVRVQEVLRTLLASVGLAVVAFGTADDFLAAWRDDQPGCLVTEVRLCGLSGLELLQRRAEHGIHLPAIVLTAHGDIPTCVRALKAGAIDFLEKPANEHDLLERIQQAIRLDARLRLVRADRAALADRLARLTPREREVLDLVRAGTCNKVICSRLTITRKTLGIHRAKIMKKFEVTNLPQLLRILFTTSLSVDESEGQPGRHGDGTPPAAGA
jgi:FixJ family two-component response regulator